jgi:septal ring factor EnvC (AmiA/AmiB activator)
MNLSSYFLTPVFFFGLLFILSIAFILLIRSLSLQDKKNEEALKKANSDIDKLNTELSLKNQMFEGLKGQYNELEKDYEKLTQQVQENKTTGPATIKPASQ